MIIHFLPLRHSDLSWDAPAILKASCGQLLTPRKESTSHVKFVTCWRCIRSREFLFCTGVINAS
jgi:hypothetical protein